MKRLDRFVCGLKVRENVLQAVSRERAEVVCHTSVIRVAVIYLWDHHSCTSASASLASMTTILHVLILCHLLPHLVQVELYNPQKKLQTSLQHDRNFAVVDGLVIQLPDNSIRYRKIAVA